MVYPPYYLWLKVYYYNVTISYLLQEDYEPPTIPFDLPSYLPSDKQDTFGVEIRKSQFCLDVGHVSSRVI